MKRMVYGLIVTGSCVAMQSTKRFEQHLRNVKHVELYHNHHFTQIRFNRENAHTRCRMYKHRDYTPKSKR